MHGLPAASKIKRSMSVRPSPIMSEIEPRFPSREDPRWVLDEGWKGPWGYVITRVTNSTDYRPGLHLSRARVNELIEAGWTVSVLSKV
jgi:hypothetical protein